MGELRFLDGELLFDSGELAMSDNCCCDCDCETGGPTAGFSYEQTDGDPCTMSLTDESTPGTCGDIVAWSWKVNGVEVSTAQNPTGIEYEDGDTVELTVTDEGDCTDVVEGDVACGWDCTGCSGEVLPVTVTVTISGWYKEASPGVYTLSADINQTHTLTYVDGSNPCEWEKIGTYADAPGCNGNEYRIRVRRSSTANTLEVRLWTSWNPLQTVSQIVWSSAPADPCIATYTGVPHTSGASSHCVLSGIPGSGTPTGDVDVTI
jgi:hypothetical protein